MLTTKVASAKITLSTADSWFPGQKGIKNANRGKRNWFLISVAKQIFFMAKTKEKKKELIDQLAQDLKENEMVVIADYQGLSNPELQELREQLKKDKAKVRVVKNTLFQIALRKAGLEVDEKLFCRPLLVSTSQGISPTKIFDQTSEEVENLEVLGGIYQGEYQDQSFIEKLARIPSREELLVQLVGQLKAPYYGLANVLKGNILKLLYILREKSKVRE